jgi:hypothetical protein
MEASERPQRCAWFGGCGMVKMVSQFYQGVPGLCCECAERMAQEFEVPLDMVYWASFAIECGIKAEKEAHGMAKRVATEKAAAGTLRLDSRPPGMAHSLRRMGMKSFCAEMIKMVQIDPKDYARAAQISNQYKKWIRAQYRV